MDKFLEPQNQPQKLKLSKSELMARLKSLPKSQLREVLDNLKQIKKQKAQKTDSRLDF